MSHQIYNNSSEFVCPHWVHDPTVLLDNLSHYMVDVITSLRTVDQQYSLQKAWLDNDLSPRERARVIMQYMEHRPWLAATEEEFEIRLESYVRPDFVVEHEAQVDHFFDLVSSWIPGINDGYRNYAYLELCLESRAFFETILTLVLVGEDEEAEERHIHVDYNHIRNTQSSASSSESAAAATAAVNNSNIRRSTPGSNSRSNSQTPYWGSSPLGSLMDTPVVQRLREQLQSNIARYPEQSVVLSLLERNDERQCQLVRRTDVSKPLQQKRPQPSSHIGPQKQQQLKINDCCYVEQSTGVTWLERHGITATYEPKPEKKRGVLRRMVKKINMWIISDSSGGYSSRWGGLEGRDDTNGNMSPPLSEDTYRLRERRH